MDEQEVGCPDPAALVDSTEWILSLVATSLRTLTSSALTGILDSSKLGVVFEDVVGLKEVLEKLEQKNE